MSVAELATNFRDVPDEGMALNPRGVAGEMTWKITPPTRSRWSLHKDACPVRGSDGVRLQRGFASAQSTVGQAVPDERECCAQYCLSDDADTADVSGTA